MSSKIKDTAFLVGIIVVVYALFHLVGIGCPIKWLTGVSCAGCGMTRAWISFLRLDFKEAFSNHPLFLAPIIVVLLYLLKNKIPKKVYNVSMFTIAILFIVVYLARMLFFDSAIVVFEPNNGVIFRMFHNG